MDLKLVGKNLKRQMRKKGLGRNELAKLTGLNRATISRYTSGDREMSIGNALRIADVLGITVDELVRF